MCFYTPILISEKVVLYSHVKEKYLLLGALVLHTQSKSNYKTKHDDDEDDDGDARMTRTLKGGCKEKNDGDKQGGNEEEKIDDDMKE